MQNLATIGEIEARAKAVGLNLSALARLAKVAPSTAWRATQPGKDCLASTIRKLARAVEAREAEVRAHLAEVEPPPKEAAE